MILSSGVAPDIPPSAGFNPGDSVQACDVARVGTSLDNVVMTISRISLLFIVLVIGIAAASLIPGLSQAVRSITGFGSATGVAARPAQEKSTAEPAEEKDGIIKLTEAQVSTAGIDLATVQAGTLARRIVVPGTIVP